VTYLTLPVGYTPLPGPVVFPGFPGLYTPGVPVSLEDIELTEAEARERIEAAGLPLELTADQKRLSVAETLDAVGTDATAAHDALELEKASEAPRKTLISRLEQVIADEGARAEAEATESARMVEEPPGNTPETAPEA
jgi:hypothetical protein